MMLRFGNQAAVCCLLVACGGSPPRVRHATTSDAVEVTRTDGIQLATLRRPLGDRVWMTLTLDAGSRDADPPQVATLAAFVAAAGLDVEPRVTPDTTEFSVVCPREALRTCADALAGALSRRRVERDTLATAARALLTRRRRAAASDARHADRLALTALLGEAASPWGSAARDDEADGDAVGRFLASHYGSNRALLLVVGDVDESAGAAAARAFRRAPTSLDARGERTQARPTPVARATGRQTYVSAALSLPTLAQAAAVGRALRDPLLGDPSLHVRVFRLRGAAIALVSRESSAPLVHGRELVERLARSAADQEALPDAAVHAAASGDPIREARAFAAGWSADSMGRGAGPALSLAVVAPEPPALEALRLAYDSGRDEAAAGQDSQDGEDSLTREVDGARVFGERAPGATRVAVAVSFLGGAREEPPALHGRAALLAQLMARRCGLDAGRLDERLQMLRGRAAPVVRADRVGVVFELPAARWREAVDLAAGCALRPPNARTDVDGARTNMLAQRGLKEDLDERVARLLDPAHPGRVAPGGSGVALARLTGGELEAAHATLATRARVRAAVVGDVPLGPATRRLARRLAALPPGEAPAALAAWPDAHSDPRADPGTRGDLPRLLLALRVHAGSAAAQGSVREFARALGRRVSGDSVTLEVTSGGSSSGGSWLAVEWRVDAALMPELPSRIAGALRDVPSPAASQANVSTPMTRAWELAASEPRARDTAAVLDALRRASPWIQIRGVGRSPTLERLQL